MSGGMTRLLMPALIAVIILQLSVPAYMIIGKYDTLRTGVEFKFMVSPVDPYDAFRGRYVNLTANQGESGRGKYGIIAVGTDGFAYVSEITDEKPKAGDYVKSGSRNWFDLPIDRYYMDEKLAPKAEAVAWERDTDTYVTVRVKNGRLVVSGLFIDGVAIEEVVNQGQQPN